ncbi:flagellar hook-length control protein FliK [Phenylobacterium sp.]|uniref:flagellar hook-length control protein FliK n=1 Tax=Phenylobacterium sp. TaxID=1871053 RepID=UPI00403622F3
MSFSLLPITPPVPAPATGAAAPVGGAAGGFEALMAALFGPANDAAAPALPGGGPSPTGQVATAPSDAVADPESEDQTEEGLVTDGQLAAVGLIIPAPVAMTAAQAQAPTTDTLATDPMAAASPAATMVGAVDLPAPDAASETPDAPQAPAGADAGEVQVEAIDVAARPTAAAPTPESVRRQSAPALTPPSAQDRPSTLPASETAAAPAQPPAPAAPPVTAQAQAATAQASAQPLMTAAAAAGVVSLRAGQSGPVTAPGVAGDSVDASEAEPEKVALGGAKTIVAAQPPSPFALTAQGPVTPKTDGPAVLVESGASQAAATAPENLEPVTSESLDGPESMAGLTTTASGTTTAEVREGARPAATSATVADLAAQVSRRLEGRSTHFDIQLTPEGLGRVDVRVDIDAQGKLTAAMAFDNPHAANEMRGRSGELMRALEQAGFDLSGGLSFNSPQDQRSGGQFADQAPDREAWQGRAFQSALGMADEADTAAVATRLYQQRQSPTGVDLRI